MNPGKIPPNASAVSPYLIVNDADAALAFYEKAFGLKARMKMTGPTGKTAHAEIMHGDSVIMVGARGAQNPPKIDDAFFMVYLYVEDVDKLYANALSHGAVSKQEPKDQFYGDRTCALIDPFNHHWYFGTHIKSMSVAEMEIAKKQTTKA